MATNYNNKIVTDGLILCLDAADKKSYSGSGSSWTDRSGQGNHGTLVNSPAVGSGYIELDGTDDRIATGSKLSGTENGSIYLWCNPSTPSTGNNVLVYQSSGVGRIWIYMSQSGVLVLNTYFGSGMDFYLTGTGTNMLNKWGLVTITFDRNGYQKIYYNAEFITSSDISTASAVSWNSGTLALGSFDYNGPSWYAAAYKAANFLVYNVEHSAEQIAQNFNAQRGRFGI